MRDSESRDPGLINKVFSQFYLALTDRCNLKCIMCTTTTHQSEAPQELALNDWLNILENITRFKIERISFGGGEPFIRKDDLTQLIRFCGSKHIRMDIVTNGTLITRDFIERIEDLKEYIHFIISCDGLERENDLIRGKGTFKKIVAALDLVNSCGFCNYLSSVIMPENFSAFIEFLSFFSARYPGTLIDIQPVIPHNEVYHLRRSFDLSADQITELENIMNFLRDNPDIRLCRPLRIIEKYIDYFKGALRITNQCKMGTQSFNINVRGNIWICGKELNFPLHKNNLETVFESDQYAIEMKRVVNCTSPCLAGLVI